MSTVNGILSFEGDEFKWEKQGEKEYVITYDNRGVYLEFIMEQDEDGDWELYNLDVLVDEEEEDTPNIFDLREELVEEVKEKLNL